MNKTTILLLLAVVMSGCVSKHQATKKELFQLDTQHFKDITTVANVQSGSAVEFSTLNGYRPEKFIGVGWLDSFLKGYVNKKTGKRYYQVYQFISYQGRGWRLYQQVDYETPEGKTSKPLTRYHRELLNCASSRGCTYEEHVVFDTEKNSRTRAFSPREGKYFSKISCFFIPTIL
jgi:starvation-inducible outer membrane lipoprotein